MDVVLAYHSRHKLVSRSDLLAFCPALLVKEVDQDKLNATHNIPPPTTKKELNSWG